MLLCLLAILVGVLTACGLPDYCPGSDHLNVYAADDLKNGTVRLYQGRSYCQLTVAVHRCSDGHWSAASVLQQCGQLDRLFSNLEPPGLSLVDTWQNQTSVFSLSDRARGREQTFVLVTTVSPAHGHWLPGRLLVVDTETGSVVHQAPLRAPPEADTEATDADLLVRVMAAWRLQMAGGHQYLFQILNRRLFWAAIDVDDFGSEWPVATARMVHDTAGRFHRGAIPTATAAFVVQSPTGTVLVLILCRLYCLVELTGDAVFDFEPCNDPGRWQDLQSWLQEGPAVPAPPWWHYGAVSLLLVLVVLMAGVLCGICLSDRCQSGTYHVDRMESCRK